MHAALSSAGQVNRGSNLRGKAMRITCENAISKPPEAVFPWIAEPEKAMKWQKNVKGGEIIRNEPGIVGTTFKEVIEEGGKSLEMRGIVTKYIENEIMGFHLESKMHEVDVCYSIEGMDKETKISVEAIIEWKFPMNIISLFVGNRMKKGLVEQLESEILDLKRICETAQ